MKNVESQVVYLFVFDTLADWEPGYAITGINNPQFQKQPGRYSVKTVGLNLEPVTTIGGVRIQPDLALDDLIPSASAMLIIPGGSLWNERPDDLVKVIDTACEFLAAGVPVAAICGATAGLARGGLLDERRHTSNAREYLDATNYHGSALYEDAPAVTDRDVITAPGTSALDFACHIFRRLDVYTDEVLDAWFGLFKTGQPEYFYALMQAADRD